MADIQWQPDILGDGYTQTVLELGTDPDGEGQIAAVLVRRDPRDGEVAEGAVLYVHGFSDYFFQTDRKSTRLNSSHDELSRMPSSA